MSEEKITYDEFMIMFKNAPRLAYMLYDKAEDEIDRLNNIINKAIEYIENEKNKQNSVGVYKKDIHKNLLKILKDNK